jgi:hypothetical protein
MCRVGLLTVGFSEGSKCHIIHQWCKWYHPLTCAWGILVCNNASNASGYYNIQKKANWLRKYLCNDGRIVSAKQAVQDMWLWWLRCWKKPGKLSKWNYFRLTLDINANIQSLNNDTVQWKQKVWLNECTSDAEIQLTKVGSILVNSWKKFEMQLHMYFSKHFKNLNN